MKVLGCVCFLIAYVATSIEIAQETQQTNLVRRQGGKHSTVQMSVSSDGEIHTSNGDINLVDDDDYYYDDHDHGGAFPTCDLTCIKAASAAMGADALFPSTTLKYWMDVRYEDLSADVGEACGFNHVFPPVECFHVNPSTPTKVTTAETRKEPVVTFSCTPGRKYHLIMQDSLNGKIVPWYGYTHWVKLNMYCCASGEGSTAKGGTDVHQGFINGYLPPAFPYNAFHHFNFALFESDAELSVPEYSQFMKEKNSLKGGVTIKAHMAKWPALGAPVARSWIDITTSYWSKVRMDRITGGKVIPGFTDLICPCNEYANAEKKECVAIKTRGKEDDKK